MDDANRDKAKDKSDKFEATYQLITRLIEGETAFANSWDHVRNLRKLFEDCENYPVLHSLELSWEELESSYNNQEWPDLIKRDADEGISETPLEAFMYYIEMGFYPSPEIMLSIIDAFNMYFAGAGKHTLEDVFFGKEKKWIGNHAAVRAKDNLYERFHFYIDLKSHGVDKLGNKKKSMEDMAADFFESMLSPKLTENIDIDTFLRNYRRWKVRWYDKKGKRT